MSTSLALAAESDIGTQAHDATAQLSPAWSPANTSVTYTATIENDDDSDDAIRRVYIYQNHDYTDLECNPVTGWNVNEVNDFAGPTGQDFNACLYSTSNTSQMISVGDSLDFTFDSTTPAQESCELTWHFETQDQTGAEDGEWVELTAETGVDITDPTFEKTLAGDTYHTEGNACPPGDGQACFINQDTKIKVEVTDPGDASCGETDVIPSGLAYCTVRVTVDGEHKSQYYRNVTPETDDDHDVDPNQIFFKTDFDEDSHHEFSFTCYDNAGNQLTDTETFKVDDTAPETSLNFTGPQKHENFTTWIDTDTKVVLDAVDPESENYPEYNHSSGVKETKYKIFGPLSDEACLGGSDFTDGEVEAAGGSHEYETYDEPFHMPEESCHKLKYFSVDNMGNVEDKNHMYFYVDKTPPAIEKTISEHKAPLLDFLGDERYQTLFSDDNISDYWTGDRTFPTDGVYSVSAHSRNDVLQMGIDSSQTSNADDFYRTEGVKTTNATDFGTAMQVDLYVDPAWEDTAMRAGFWVVGDDGSGGTDGNYGIIEFVNNEPCAESDCSNQGNIQNHTGWRFWNTSGSGTWTTSDAPFTYGEWATLSIVLDTDAQQYKYYLNSDYIGSGPGGDHSIEEIFLNSYNYGEDSFPTLDSESYQAHWHGLTPVLDWYVSADTGITLMCEDQQPHPSGGETIHYSLERTTDGENYNEVDGGSVQTTQHTIDFENPSQHKLTWYCTDAVNKTSEQDIEYFKADFEPPVINKTVTGPQLGDCPPAPGSDEVCAISGETNVTVNVSDNESIHASHGVTCSYDVYWNDDTLESGTFGAEGKVFNWDEDSNHTLDITCQDRVGNSVTDVEKFNVDLTPPETTKHYKEPSVVADGYRWITSDTPIKLYGDDHKSDVESIHYNYTWVSDELCTEHATDYPYGMSDRWDSVAEGEYPSTNELNKDSQPPIRPGDAAPYVQLVDKGEGYVELQFVNNAPGLAIFEYRIDGQEVGNESHPVVTGDVKHPRLNVTSGTNTTQTFNADALVEVRLVLGGERDWDFAWTPFHVEPDSESFTSVEGDYANFSIGQTSCHKITYYAIDSFGNQELTNFQYVNVDNEGPEINKTIGQPSIELAGAEREETCEVSDFGGQVSPASLAGSLGVNEYCMVEKNVTTGETAAADPEIYFLVDSTGSMAGEISDVQSNLASILASVNASYGVGDYKDFPDESFAFLNRQSITADDADVTTAINALNAGGGGDGPEGQLYALQQIADGAAGFSPDATKIVVWFGDAPGHDPICTNISGAASNITQSSVESALQAAGIKVIAISVTGGAGGLNDDPSSGAGDYSSYCTIGGTPGQGTDIATATGGQFLDNVDDDDISAAISDAIGEATSTTDIVPDASQCTAQGIDVSFSPSSHTDVGPLTTVDFEETVTRTDAAANGTVECEVLFRSGESGGVIGSQNITVEQGNVSAGAGVHYMVTQDTPITLACSDVQPHPVGDVELSYRMRVADDCSDLSGIDWGDWTNVPGGELLEHTFSFGEDSCHELEYVCTDALGNTQGSQYEIDIVDTVAPETELHISEPKHEADGVTWADSATEFNFSAVDPQPHPSGLNDTYYRVAQVPNAYCEGTTDEPVCLADESTESFNVAVETFGDLAVEYTSDSSGVSVTATVPEDFVDESRDNVAFTFDSDASGVADFQLSYNSDEDAHYSDSYWGYQEVVSGSWGSWQAVPGDITVDQVAADTYEIHVPASYFTCGDFRLGVAGGYADGDLGGSLERDITENGNLGFSWPSDFSWGTDFVTTEDYYQTGFDSEYQVADGEFSFSEESCHAIEYYSTDNLGNEESAQTEFVFKDETPPSIEKQYEGPFFDDYFETNESSYYAKFIHPTMTNISVFVEDDDPHPSGLAEAEWRVTQVEDEYCRHSDERLVAGSVDNGYNDYNQYTCDADGAGEWTSFEGATAKFQAGQESCHLIEVRAVDNVNKSSEHKQCVFVDGQAPDTNKTVGDPVSLMSEENIELGNAFFSEEEGYEPALTQEFCDESEMNCLEVTTLTPIDMACTDGEPHPSGGETVHFKVDFDGTDVTEDYCPDEGGEMVDGYCVVDDKQHLTFQKESWHRLEYKCEDNVGNVGEPDIEYFKVEGTAFNLSLNEKWNLVSVPIRLQNGALDEVFADHDEVVSTWTYDNSNGEWFVHTPDGNSSNDNLNTMTPGWGYWVLTTDDTEVTIGGSLFNAGPTTPPNKAIYPGWNLVGHYGTNGLQNEITSIPDFDNPQGDVPRCEMSTLYPSTDALLVGAVQTYWEPDNPNGWEDLNVYEDEMTPGMGYWVLYSSNNPGSIGHYAPSGSNCPSLLALLSN